MPLTLPCKWGNISRRNLLYTAVMPAARLPLLPDKSQPAYSSGWTNTLVVSGVIVILIILSRINFRSYLANWRILFILVLITVLLQILLIPGKTILRLSFINITQEGLISGSMLLVKLSGIILLAAWLTFTTRPAQLTAGLERIFSPLGKLGFPVQELVMIMTLSLRFLPLLVEETLMVYRAQLVRGANWRTGTLGQKVVI